MDPDDRIRQLEAEVAALRLLVEQRLAPAVAPPATAAPETSSRRQLLRLAGATAVGAVAAVAVADAAAATNGVTLAGSATTTTSLTQTNYTGSTTGDAFLFASTSGYDGASSFRPSLLTAKTNTAASPNGMYGLTDVANSAGVIGEASNTNSVGVLGLSTASTGGVFSGVTGVSAFGSTAGVSADSSAYGVSTTGNKAALRIVSGRNAPSVRGDAHVMGEVDTDLNGDLWYCHTSGTPGVWRKISGKTVAGSYHAINPGRGYDTRYLAPGNARLSTTNGPLSFTVAFGYAGGTATIIRNPLIPVGATAVTCNVTVTRTIGTGFITINPYNVGTTDSSTINWFGTDQTFANGITVKLGGDRQLTAVCSGSGSPSAHLIVDITGYFL